MAFAGIIMMKDGAYQQNSYYGKALFPLTGHLEPAVK